MKEMTAVDGAEEPVPPAPTPATPALEAGELPGVEKGVALAIPAVPMPSPMPPQPCVVGPLVEPRMFPAIGPRVDLIGSRGVRRLADLYRRTTRR